MRVMHTIVMIFLFIAECNPPLVILQKVLLLPSMRTTMCLIAPSLPIAATTARRLLHTKKRARSLKRLIGISSKTFLAGYDPFAYTSTRLFCSISSTSNSSRKPMTSCKNLEFMPLVLAESCWKFLSWSRSNWMNWRNPAKEISEACTDNISHECNC